MGLIWATLKRIPQIFVLGFFALVMTNCTMLGLNYASLETDNKPEAYPPIELTTIADWSRQSARLQGVFRTEMYGPWPLGLPTRLVSRRVVDDAFSDGRGTLEELVIRIGEGDGARQFHLALAIPNSANKAAVPLVIGQTFSSNCSVFPSAGLTGPDGAPCGDSNMPGLVSMIFGEFIAKVPIDQYFDRGYAYANYYASEIVPDRDGAAQRVMAGLTDNKSIRPTGALMAWAYGWTAAIDLVEADPRIDHERIAAWGHSRHAKSALLAGIFEPRLAAVLSHQSGYGGAASNRSTTGEGIKRMVDGAKLTPLGPSLPGYPHWFAPEFASFAKRVHDIPVDQHQLLALLAPTPVLLSNGRRDVWSDPNSTWKMAEAADPVYELQFREGLNQPDMRTFNPAADIAYFIRPGGHGTHQSDIDAFLAFLDAHVGGCGPYGKIAGQAREADGNGKAC